MRANEQFPKDKSHLRIGNTKTIGKRNILLNHTQKEISCTLMNAHFFAFAHNKLNKLLLVL